MYVVPNSIAIHLKALKIFNIEPKNINLELVPQSDSGDVFKVIGLITI